jgi:hypothetical protein
VPTSRYESYPLPDKNETKEEIVGEGRVEKYLASLALSQVLSPEED